MRDAKTVVENDVTLAKVADAADKVAAAMERLYEHKKPKRLISLRGNVKRSAY